MMCRDHLGYYDALGLEPGAASLPAIKDAFRQAALIWHPDRQKVHISTDHVLHLQKIATAVAEAIVHNAVLLMLTQL